MNEKTQARTPGFGDSAMALDVVMQLTIDLLAHSDRDFAEAMKSAIEELLQGGEVPPGVAQALQSWKGHIEAASR